MSPCSSSGRSMATTSALPVAVAASTTSNPAFLAFPALSDPGSSPTMTSLHPPGSGPPRRPRDLADSDRREQLDQRVDLLLVARHLDRVAPGRDVDDLCAEYVHPAHHPRAR